MNFLMKSYEGGLKMVGLSGAFMIKMIHLSADGNGCFSSTIGRSPNCLLIVETLLGV